MNFCKRDRENEEKDTALNFRKTTPIFFPTLKSTLLLRFDDILYDLRSNQDKFLFTLDFFITIRWEALCGRWLGGGGVVSGGEWILWRDFGEGRGRKGNNDKQPE